MVAATPVTIEQAAAILGLSTSTVRRRIRAGVLRVQEVSRPQGIMRLVYLPDDVDPAVTQVSEPAGAVATTPVTGSGDAMIAYTQTLLVPLVEALQQSEARAREQAEQLGRLAERLDHVTAELDALRASQAQQDANPGPEHADPTREPSPSRWRVLASWVPLLLMLALATVTLLLTLIVLALT